jgi:hypothetical protein
MFDTTDKLLERTGEPFNSVNLRETHFQLDRTFVGQNAQTPESRVCHDISAPFRQTGASAQQTYQLQSSAGLVGTCIALFSTFAHPTEVFGPQRGDRSDNLAVTELFHSLTWVRPRPFKSSSARSVGSASPQSDSNGFGASPLFRHQTKQILDSQVVVREMAHLTGVLCDSVRFSGSLLFNSNWNSTNEMLVGCDFANSVRDVGGFLTSGTLPPSNSEFNVASALFGQTLTMSPGHGEDDSGGQAAVIGAIVGVIVALILIGVTVAVIVLRRKEMPDNDSSSIDACSGGSDCPVETHVTTAPTTDVQTISERDLTALHMGGILHFDTANMLTETESFDGTSSPIGRNLWN